MLFSEGWFGLVLVKVHNTDNKREEQSLQEFRDLQVSSHFAQGDYTARTVHRCLVLLALNLMMLVVLVLLLVFK
tara:strand:- start:854 stop:1075 length:222 start_codon:yes stop_codon:yes gene_type:complete